MTPDARAGLLEHWCCIAVKNSIFSNKDWQICFLFIPSAGELYNARQYLFQQTFLTPNSILDAVFALACLVFLSKEKSISNIFHFYCSSANRPHLRSTYLLLFRGNKCSRIWPIAPSYFAQFFSPYHWEKTVSATYPTKMYCSRLEILFL